MRQLSGRARAWLVSLVSLVVGCAASEKEGSGPRHLADASVDGAPTANVELASALPDGVEQPKEEPVPDGPRLFAYDGFEKIVQKPDTKSALIGLIRAGQSVPLKDPKPLRGPGIGQCKGGFYAILPRGFVCAGYHSTVDGSDPRFRAAREVLMDPKKATPSRYGVLIADAPQYLRIPNATEQRAAEKGLDDYLKKLGSGAIAIKEGKRDEKPAGHGPSKAFREYIDITKPKLVAEEAAYEGRKMAFTNEFDAEGRTFLMTPDLTLVPKDKVRFVEGSILKGVDLTKGEKKFPFGYTWIEDAPKLTRYKDGTFVETGEVFPRHTFIQLEGQIVRGKGGNYWKTAEGTFVRNELVTIFKKRQDRPAGVGKDGKWVEVRITWGTLVAYEGDTPVFATAISPGVDGVTPRAHGHNTKRGAYTIGWKLISHDMNGVEKSKSWAVDDVPFVAYYKDGYALHEAWWHDDFGRPKSHGCINLAPADAQWLWGWLDPGLPEGWYAVAAFHPEVKGSTVLVGP